MLSHSGGVKAVQRNATRIEIVTIVSHDSEERVITLKNPAFEIPNEYPNDVGVDQGSNLCFAFTNLTFSFLGRSNVGHGSNEFGVAGRMNQL